MGIPAFEDKIVQRAVTMRWGALYEQDFHACSHGFREGHRPHQARREWREQGLEGSIGGIVDAEVRGCCDRLDHDRRRDMIRPRGKDGRIVALLSQWLNAGVLDGETLTSPAHGPPPGGVRSPMLANSFLHHVLDEWVVREVKPRMKGRCLLTRVADDLIIGCEGEDDARRIMAVLPQRCARFGLTIHPTKTALLAFRKPASHTEADMGNGPFECLGCTHYGTKSRRGDWVITRRTASKRLRRTRKALWQWGRDQRHTPLKAQYRIFCQKLRGPYQYYGIRGNYPRLEQLSEHAVHAWRYWLSRRSRQSAMPWAKFAWLRGRYPLPPPTLVHAI